MLYRDMQTYQGTGSLVLFCFQFLQFCFLFCDRIISLAAGNYQNSSGKQGRKIIPIHKMV